MQAMMQEAACLDPAPDDHSITTMHDRRGKVTSSIRQIRTSIGRRATVLWTQIIRTAWRPGGHLGNQLGEQIGDPASGDTSHVVKASDLLLMTEEVELRFPFAGISHGSSAMRPGAGEAA